MVTDSKDYFLKNKSNNNSEEKEAQKIYNIEKLNSGGLPIFNFIHQAEIPQMDSEDILCKICYSSLNEKDNPLVNLCNICTGGIKYSHFSCLKIWMQTKLSVKENPKKNVKSYNIKQYNCEICKTPYPCKKIIVLFYMESYIFSIFYIAG